MGNNVHKRVMRRLHRIYVLSACFLFFPKVPCGCMRMGTLPIISNVHTVAQVVAHIGHTEEMYQMVLAVINQRNDDLSVF